MNKLTKIIAALLTIIIVCITLLPNISLMAESIEENKITSENKIEESEENQIITETNESNQTSEEAITETDSDNEKEEIKESDDNSDDNNSEKVNTVSKEILEKKPELEPETNKETGKKVAVDENSITYKLNNNTYKKVYSAYPNTYVDEDGNTKEIDNTLITENENYTNSANSFDVTLPKNEIKEDKPITVENNNKKIELIPTEGDFSHSVVLKNAVRYNNVFDGIDFQYTSLNISLKEDIILNKQVEKNEFIYKIKADDNLNFKQESNYVIVTDEEGKRIYTIEAPIMEDANHELYAGLQVVLEEKDNEKYIKIIANKEWLDAPERAYPVKIDPTITGNQNQHDYFVPVQEYEPNLELGNINYTYVGYDNGRATGTGGSGHGIIRIYSKINMGDIPQDAVISEANYTVYQRSTFYQRANSTGTRGEMGLYAVTQDWRGNMSWNNQPFEGQEFVDSHQMLDSAGYITYNIRDLVNDWVRGLKPNKGICLKMISENTMQCELIGSAAAGNTLNPAWAPTFSITYVVPDAVDENLGLNALTINLRPMTEKNISGKLQFDGVFADGISKPGTIVNYWINPFEGFIGRTFAFDRYRFPNSEGFETAFPEANKYKDKTSNWQTDAIYTAPQYNRLYKFHAQAVDSENNTSEEKTSDSFIIYQVKQRDTLPYIANYYGVPLKTIMRDNRVQDTLLVENNTLFIRNPNQNAEKPYNPELLTDGKKKEIDGALRGRHLHCEYGYEPVNLNTGNFYMSKTDASIPEINDNFTINRTYNSTGEGYNSVFGRNWDFEYAESISKLEDGTLVYQKGDGKTYYFENDGNGGFTTPYGTNLKLKEITYNVDGDLETRVKYEIQDGTEETRKFNSYGLLESIIDKQQHETKIEYNAELEISKIISPTGKTYKITMQNGKISKIELPNNAILQYEYDENSNLVKFINAEGNAETYQYNDKNQMTACVDAFGVTSVRNEYDEQGRVIKQYDAKNQMVTLKYEVGKTTTTDGNGNQTIYYYDSRYYTTRIEYPNGTNEQKLYDYNGNLIRYKDKAGNVYGYEYDSNHNQTKIIRIDEAISTIEYNEQNLPTKVVDFDGKYVIHEYDSKGNIIKTTNNAGITNQYTYDSQDRLVSRTDANGNTTTYTFDGANITSITDANGNTSKIYYNAMNQVTGLENAKGEIKRITYNKNGDKTLEQFPDGTTNSYSYDAKGRMVATIDAKGNKIEFQYDEADNVVKAIKPDGGIITRNYDANKNKISEIDELERTTTYQYDSLDRLIKQTDANGNETKYEYDNSNNITKITDALGHSTQMKFNTITNVMLEETDANNNTAKYEYNVIGLLTKKTDKDGLVTEIVYDEANRIKEQKLPTGENITYTYDNNGNVLKIESNSGRNYTYEYDKLNNITKIIDALGNEQSISYDAAQDIKEITDVNGEITKYTYDSMGRVAQIQNQLNNIEKFAYDANGNQAQYTDFNDNKTKYEYDSLNRINKKIDALGNTTKYEYDSIGNLVKETDALGNSIISEYSVNNQLTKVTDAKGNAYKLEYDGVGNNTKIIDAKGNETTLEYDNENQLIKTTNALGTVTNYEYDAVGRITSVKDSTGNKINYSYDKGRLVKLEDNIGRTIEYEYDLAGNITKIKNYDDTITIYEYDLLNRLTKYTDPEEKTTTFEYDKLGNLIKKTDSTERIWKYEYDKLGNIKKSTDPQNAVTSFEYDANNNLLKTINALGKAKTYTYDALNRITNIVNENEAETKIGYDALSQITSVQKPEGGIITRQYDANKNIIKEIDELGNETNYTYNELDNLVQAINPNGATTNYEYDVLGNITKITDALGNVTNNKVDANGLLQEKTLANGAKYTYSYDEVKRLTKVSAPEGVERTFKYDKADNLVEEIDSNGNSTKYEYDIMKRLKGVTNANGNKTSYEYDEKGNLSSVIDAKGAITKYEYNIVDELEKQVDPTGVVTTFEHDILGNVTKQDRSGGRVTTYEYDNVGNLVKSTNALGNSKLFTYNKENQLTSNTDELGNTNTYKYDLKGQLVEVTNANNAKKSYTYDVNGNISSATDELGNMKKYSYDLLDRLVQVEDEKSHKTTYKYDSVGNLAEQTDANGNTTKYDYDQLSRLKQITDAKGNVTTYNYDKLSNLKEVIKPDGKKISYDYDKINNLIAKGSEQDKTINSMYSYDPTGKLVEMYDSIGNTSYEYDQAGRIAKVTIQDGKQLEYKYDDLSRISEIVYPDGKSVKYTYDVLDNLKTVVDRDGNTTTYDYDAKNRVIKVTRPNGSYTTISYNELDGVSKLENNTAEGMVSSFEYKYNDKGQIVKETATNKDVKSVKEFAYDAKGELESFVENRNGVMIYTTYSYDNVGNRISKEVKKTDQNVRTNYTYNELNQLTTESEEGKSDINYSYDANGNLVEKNDGERTLTYSYTVEDRLQAVKEGNQILMAAIYDGNGDRVFTLRPSKNPPAETLIRMNNPKTGDDIIVYIAIFVASIVVIIMFNSKNEKVKKAGIGLLTVLVVAGSATIITINSNKENESYTPNVPSNKESRQINEDMIFIPFGVNENDQNRYELTQYINDVTTQNTQVLMEYSNESGITAYTYGNERLSYETNGVNYKYNYDGRGSVTNLIDNTNTSVVEYNYQPFGETEIIGTKAQELENTYQFNAESTDALTGLQYLRARYYDSKTGRFTSADTYLGEITDPLSRNLYLYTKNDPVNYVDPSGHLFETIMQMADTAKNLYQKASEEAIQKIETSNFIPSAMKTALKTAINTQVSKTINKYENRKSTTKPTIETVIENIKKNEPASPSRQAAINEKVEYAKALEQKIKECRSLNTMEANRIAEELEYQMRLLCDDNLDRVDVQKSAEKITSILKESVQSKMKKSSDEAFSATVGFVSTLALDTIEFWGGITTAAGYFITFQNPIEGYGKFREVIVDPLRETIEENVPDKDAYDIGTKVAIGYEIFEAGKFFVKLTTKVVPKIFGKIKGTIGSTAKTIEAGSETGKAIGESNKLNYGNLKNTEGVSITNPSSKKLRENMIASGQIEPSYKNAAHHIVAGSSPKATEARSILEKYGIDINSSDNGVFLPTERVGAGASYHPSLHTNEYYRKVNMLLNNANSREDVLDILNMIREDLLDGSF